MTAAPMDRADDLEVLDVVGIGFGPSNLALAIAVEEHNADQEHAAVDGEPLRVRFLERQRRFGWHRGMLLDDATMQVAFLKDLVTMRNPNSDFSFVSYLHGIGRLVDFINLNTAYPFRIEFHDYLEWAAERLDHLVDYGTTVESVRPVLDDAGTVVAWDVLARRADGEPAPVLRARNVVVAAGLRPLLPAGIDAGERVWHTRDLLFQVDKLDTDAEVRRVVVVGAGQSAAEAVAHLHDRFGEAEVVSVFGRWGFSPADDSSFANSIFDPDSVDVFHGAEPAVRQRLLDYHRNTNYAVVDRDLIEDLYRRVYREKVTGRQRLRMMNTTLVTAQDVDAAGVTVTVEHLPTGTEEQLSADAVVYATGYEPVDPTDLLGDARALVCRDAEGRPEIGRDHALVLDTAATAALYTQGASEHTHGLSSTLLSTVAVRAGEVLASVTAP